MPPKPRDFAADRQALLDRQRRLEAEQRKLDQQERLHWGALVLDTGAHALGHEALRGVLLAAVEKAASTPAALEGWRRRGAAAFRGDDAGRSEPARRDGASGGSGLGGDVAGDPGAAAAARPPAAAP